MVRCETCKHWDQLFSENKGLGVCQRVGILVCDLAGADVYAALSDSDIRPPVQETAPGEKSVQLRTRINFGCVFWLANR